MKKLALALLLLIPTASANAQCVPCSGPGWSLSCSAAVAVVQSGQQVCGLEPGGGGGSTCPPFPADLTSRLPETEPGSLHALVVDQFTEDWTNGGGDLQDLFFDERRDFLRKALWSVMKENPEVAGSFAEFRAAAQHHLFLQLTRCLKRTTVRMVPTGDGGREPELLPSSTNSTADCAGATLAVLVRMIRPRFMAAELSPFVVDEQSLLAAQEQSTAELLMLLESHEEQLAAIAVAVADFGAEDLEAGLWQIGSDEEGGRQ